MKKAAIAVLFVALIILSYAVGRHSSPGNNSPVAAGRRVLYYVDPMHPAYKSDKPGIAPDCGMQLEPVYADGTAAIAADAPAGTVSIDAERQQLIGVKVAAVDQTAVTRTVRILGKVAADETRVYKVNSGAEGWVRQTFNDSVGTLVKKDQKLATYYSPEFIAVQAGYLAATDRVLAAVKEAAKGTQNYADRLRNLGMSDAQIKELGETRQAPDSIYVVSPVDGFIAARSISPGQRFDRGSEFYRIVDLTHIWILADVFENEAQYFRPGTTATVTLSNQGKTLRATVSTVLPQFDPNTRTLKVRLEAENPDFVLRPDMFVDVTLPVAAPRGLSVPADAVIVSGLSQRVFIERGNGVFEPRQVETGGHFGDRVQIVKGLEQNDRVVVSGTFMVDSESRLKEAAAGATQMAAQPRHHGREMPEMKPVKASSSMESGSDTKDPRCGMKVDPAKSAAAGNTLDYHGTTYYFCSKDCKEKFGKEPDHYLALGHSERTHD